MNYDELDCQSVTTREAEVSAAFPALMRKVYVWMTFALAITGITAYLVATNETLLTLIYSHQAVMWVLIIAEFGLVIGLSSAINRLSLMAATAMFILYSVLNGAVFSSIFFAFTMGNIAKVFFITAGTFAAMSLYGYTTKSDLTSMG